MNNSVNNAILQAILANAAAQNLPQGPFGVNNSAYNAPLPYAPSSNLNSAYNALFMAQYPRHRCNLNLEEHQKYADALVLAGIIDENTGKSIKQKMAAVFRAESGAPVQGGATGQNTQGNAGTMAPQNLTGQGSVFESEFLKARECLLEYLQNLDVELDFADLEQIENVVLELEKQAISRNLGDFQGNSALKTPENLQNSVYLANEAAKERLIGSPFGAKGAKGLPQKAFTREEIAKMSTAEFIKNEPQINYQLQNGLL